MKKIAILAIAATNQPVYVHYLNNYWTELIRYTNKQKPHVDVFLLFENDADISAFAHLEANIIQDQNCEPDLLCHPHFQTINIPGILSKTIFALELLQSKYDVFFRTNLSSVIRTSTFERHVQEAPSLCYSGAAVWTDALRDDSAHHNRIGAGKSIESLDELESYEGNTFISGSGYFLNATEVKFLVEEKKRIRYDLPDDVAVGLMFSEHQWLANFSVTVRPNNPITDSIDMIEQHAPSHIRLENFPLERAEALWEKLHARQIWA